MYTELLLEFLHLLTFAIVYFTFIWWAAKQINNWSIVDIFWSYGFAVVGIKYLYSYFSKITGPTFILIVLTIFWSLRLGTHLAKRIFGDIQHEDGRYVKLRKQWAKDLNFKMFQFFMLQAVILAILLTPIASSVLHEQKSLQPVHVVGVVIAVFALIGELIADQQLRNFKKTAPRSKVCDVGLWTWTRHPNYFFEWLIWVGFALLSYNDSYYAVPGILCAGLMFYLLTKVSGIPMTEEHLLSSKGEAYKKYQQEVPAFWPRKPKVKSKV